ncbi:MAG: hypothetical protein RLY16_2585 [Bacteroidota bacterium]
MRYIFFWLLLVTNTVSAQTYTQFDTIADPTKALAKLYLAFAAAPNNAALPSLIAQRKFQIAQYDSCIHYCNQSIALLTQSKNNKLLARVLHTKGNAQYYLDDKFKAAENWRQGLNLAVQEKDAERLIKLASNLGAIYLDEAYLKRETVSNFKTADSFFAIAYRALQQQNALGSEQGLRTLRLIATSLHFQKKNDSADYYYKKVLTLSKASNADTYLGVLTFYAEFLSEIGRHAEAQNYMKEALQLGIDSNITSKDKTHLFHVNGNVLYKSGQFKAAYDFNDSAFQLLAADYQKINAQAYSESESKFKNQILQYQIQLEQQKKTRLYYLIGALVLLTGFIVLGLLHQNNKRIAKEKARQKQIAIDAFIEGEEKEKARIGRELHDGIAQEIVGIKLAMQQQNAEAPLVNELTRICLEIRNISHELMPLTLKEFGLKLAIEDSCQKILTPSGIQFEIHSNLPNERLSNKIEITLYRIFQELIHNIIKHSQATEVMVQLRKMNNHVLLVVEDNGKGINQQKKGGIGMSNLKSRVALLDGNLQYDSIENEGTTAIIRVPV